MTSNIKPKTIFTGDNLPIMRGMNSASVLVSYGIVNWGMSRKEASDMAELTVEEMLTDAAKRKSEGLPWKMLFQPQA